MRSALFAFYLFFLIALGLATVFAAEADRKDYLLQAVETQRNEALTREVLCRADAGEQIAALQKQLVERGNSSYHAAKAACGRSISTKMTGARRTQKRRRPACQAHVTRYTLRKYLIFLGCDGVTSSVQYERHAASNCAR
jgi:hypothetical protein